MPKTVFIHRQSRNFTDLIDHRMVKHLERLASRFNRARPRKMAVFAHDHIGIHINQYGLYDKPDLELLFGFLQPLADTFRAGVALDVGANIGNHALFYAERFAAVHAFEPHPATYHLLAYNAKLAGNVTAYNHGLGSEATRLRLNEDLDNMGAASIGHGAAAAASVEIEIRRLDDLGLPLDGLCFMKVDVEGFEPQVLRGAERTIALHQPVIVLEQLEREFERGEPEGIALLRGLGFRFCWPRSAHKAKKGLARQWDSLRNRLLGQADVVEMLAGEEVPRGAYNLLVAVPPRFQALLGMA